MDYKLNKIINIEKKENRFQRHKLLADITRDWARDRYKLLVKDNNYSDTVTAVVNSRETDLKMLSSKLKDQGYVFSNGYGKLKDKTFRIAHMADTTIEELKAYLETIDKLI
mgnify:FL=1